MDLLIIAGWAHQLNGVSADHLDTQLKVPKTAKILLCSPPGSYIDAKSNENKLNIKEQSLKNELINLKYTNIFCLQLGVYAEGGLVIPPTVTLKSLDEESIREAWIDFLKKSLKEEEWSKLEKNLGKNSVKDNFVVIYCSKDIPSTSGKNFIINIAKEKMEEKPPVLLLGTMVDKDKNTENFVSWKTLCDENGLTVYPLPRTSTSEILMCGLRNARYSMTTGSFSILETKYLGIHHCAYLAPPHLQEFATILEKATNDELNNAFKRGEETLKELSLLPKENYSSKILDPKNALSGPKDKNNISFKKQEEIKDEIKYIKSENINNENLSDELINNTNME